MPGKSLDDLVGAERAVAVQQRLEHVAAHRGEPLAGDLGYSSPGHPSNSIGAVPAGVLDGDLTTSDATDARCGTRRR
jgi:hypothetical protein